MEQEYHTRINWMGHSEIEEALTSIGMACSPDESTDDLRETLRQCVMDGDIDKELLPEWR